VEAALPWSKADLHIHTRLSDGGPSPLQVVEHVLRHTDLAVIAITDHNRMDGGLRVRSLAAQYGLEVIVGEEVGTADGHLLALFIEEPIAPGRPMEDTVAEVHAQGGLAIAAHPYDAISSSLLGRGNRRWTEERLASLPLDGVEVLNGSLVRHVANLRATRTAHRLGLTMVGGSDAHHLAVIGQAHTRFPGRTAEDLRRAILAGTTEAGGRPWRVRQYLSWVGGCFIPRTVRRARSAVRAYAR
jgi:predicted metal-dependent phosphoesterase TrpH